MFFVRKPCKEPHRWDRPFLFLQEFSTDGSHYSQPWLWQPLTAFDSRGSRPSGPLRRSMDKIHAGLGPFEPKDLSHRWVFVVEKHAFWDRFFLCSSKLLAHKSSCRCSHVPVDLPFWTFLDVTLALTFPDVNKISEIVVRKRSLKDDVVVVVVSSLVLFFLFTHQLSLPLPRAHDEPRPMCKILQIVMKKLRLRTTSNQMYNGKLVQWHCAYGMMMTNLG